MKPRTALYGLMAFGQVVFSFAFPWISSPLASWLFDKKLMGLFIASFSVPFFSAVLFYSFKKWHLIQPKRRVILSCAVLLYCAAYFPLSYAPEKLHILNFSFMGIIFYKFFSPLMRIQRALVRALLITIFVGTLDEFIQKWVPGRGASVHDVMLCVEAAFLGVTIAWIFDKYSRKGRS